MDASRAVGNHGRDETTGHFGNPALLTTMGMRLSIQPLDHLGYRARLWATVNAPHGAIFRLRLPVGAASLLRNMAPNSSPNAA